MDGGRGGRDEGRRMERGCEARTRNGRERKSVVMWDKKRIVGTVEIRRIEGIP